MIQPGALAHAAAVRASYAQLASEAEAICVACDQDPTFCGHALANAETAHWQRCLASAKATGAGPMFFVANLNRYTAAGERAPIGNLAKE